MILIQIFMLPFPPPPHRFFSVLALRVNEATPLQMYYAVSDVVLKQQQFNFNNVKLVSVTFSFNTKLVM